MATDKDILDATFARMASYSTSAPIFYPDRPDSDPPSTGRWIDFDIFPNEPDDPHWASDTQVYLGFLQASVYFRPGGGEFFAAYDEVEGIQAHFPKGLQLGPVKVRKRPYPRPLVTDDAALFIPVTIEYIGLA